MKGGDEEKGKKREMCQGTGGGARLPGNHGARERERFLGIILDSPKKISQNADWGTYNQLQYLLRCRVVIVLCTNTVFLFDFFGEDVQAQLGKWEFFSRWRCGGFRGPK